MEIFYDQVTNSVSYSYRVSYFGTKHTRELFLHVSNASFFYSERKMFILLSVNIIWSSSLPFHVFRDYSLNAKKYSRNPTCLVVPNLLRNLIKDTSKSILELSQFVVEKYDFKTFPENSCSTTMQQRIRLNSSSRIGQQAGVTAPCCIEDRESSVPKQTSNVLQTVACD